MRWRDSLPVTTALLLAIMAAVLSSRPVSWQDVNDYLSEALAPQMADLGQFSMDGWRTPN